jgi:hypothetical protein
MSPRMTGTPLMLVATTSVIGPDGTPGQLSRGESKTGGVDPDGAASRGRLLPVGRRPGVSRAPGDLSVPR